MSAVAITRMTAKLAALLSWASSRRGVAPPEEQEREITTQLLAGSMSRREYHERMARLAGATPCAALPADSARDPRYVLAVVGTMLPELAPDTLCRAFVSARSGAVAADLMGQLGLTEAQAHTIVAAART